MDGDQVFNIVDRTLTCRFVPRQSPKALLVLGMSRSGTSLLTHVLHALGASLPRDLMGAAHGNPLGHFEPHDLVALNNRILESLDRRWSDPRPIAPRWFRSRPAYEFLQCITAQIRESFGDDALPVIKDPRLCRLLPLYLDALDVLDIEPLVILQVRPVNEVVQSLVDRDDLHPDLAEFLWLRSVTEAEWHSRNCRRVWVSMAETLADWPGTARRIADGLRLEWPSETAGASGDIGSLLKPRMCHSLQMPGYKDSAGWLTSAAWAAVEHGLAGNEAAAQSGFNAVRAALDDLDRLYAPFLVSLAAAPVRPPARLAAPLRALERLIGCARSG